MENLVCTLIMEGLSLLQLIAAIGGYAYIMDKDGAFRNSFSDGWDRILSKHPIPFYYCIGKLLLSKLVRFFFKNWVLDVSDYHKYKCFIDKFRLRCSFILEIK